MFIAYIVFAILLSLPLLVSGRAKLIRDPEVTATMTRLGVGTRWFPALAALEFAGALGLLIGIFWRPLGIAAAMGVVLYFAGALATHLRAGDVKGAPVPAMLVLLSAAPLVLGINSV
ncbi:DoxX family protein [Streptosporangium canum]|uniref:DoxX family protein n=1 Tax=Streptosporangium canum TaxID=324952 RepID=UPI00344876B2